MGYLLLTRILLPWELTLLIFLSFEIISNFVYSFIKYHLSVYKKNLKMKINFILIRFSFHVFSTHFAIYWIILQVIGHVYIFLKMLKYKTSSTRGTSKNYLLKFRLNDLATIGVGMEVEVVNLKFWKDVLEQII